MCGLGWSDGGLGWGPGFGLGEVEKKPRMQTYPHRTPPTPDSSVPKAVGS